jgi:hypothetical protein
MKSKGLNVHNKLTLWNPRALPKVHKELALWSVRTLLKSDNMLK